jgi:hypothetical protein
MESLDRDVLPSATQAARLLRNGSRRRNWLRKRLRPNPSQTTGKRPDPQQAQIEALRKAIAARQAEESRRLAESQAAELEQRRRVLYLDVSQKLDHLDAIQRVQDEAYLLRRKQKQTPAGIRGFLSAIQHFFLSGPRRRARSRAKTRTGTVCRGPETGT